MPPWAHIQCKSLAERCSDNPKLCGVPRILVSSPQSVFPGISVYCGTKTAVFSRGFGVEPNLLYFRGMPVRCGTKTVVFSRDFGLLWNQKCCIFQGFRSAVEPKLLYFQGIWLQNNCVLQDVGLHGARAIMLCGGLGPHGVTVPGLLCFPRISNPHDAKTTVFCRDVVIIEPKLLYSPRTLLNRRGD